MTSCSSAPNRLPSFRPPSTRSVPVGRSSPSGHRLLNGRVTFDDPDDLDALSVVTERRHGTEMASLILHGDRNLDEPSLQRPLYVRPVLYAPGGGVTERTQQNRLLIDTIYRAVLRMKEGDPEGPATAPEVFLVNLSLGDEKRPFAGPMSPWGRLLDHLADRFGILFLVSAGNVLDPLAVPAFNGMLDLEHSAVAFVDDGHMQWRVFCREQGGALDQSIRYGMAVTIEAGEGVPVYQEIRQRLGIQPHVTANAP